MNKNQRQHYRGSNLCPPLYILVGLSALFYPLSVYVLLCQQCVNCVYLRQCCVFLHQYFVHLRQYCVFLCQYCVKLRKYCVLLPEYCINLGLYFVFLCQYIAGLFSGVFYLFYYKQLTVLMIRTIKKNVDIFTLRTTFSTYLYEDQNEVLMAIHLHFIILTLS